jgi:hypothetical protein
LAVLRVVNVFPQEHVTWVTTYSGWIPCFMVMDPSALAAGSPPA